MKKDLLKCPRCKGIAFCEFECGPDGHEDDISYTSQICLKCKLYHSGWTGKWLVDCEYWTNEENAEEFVAIPQ